ncbi:uncharacterized protein LOC128921352 [Zeugodacus cucurbitae]|uniref:uncharacterized protein LOC128921352 n=1 Tax=Zeugodacus cucurbitae TaxID=28588 RepID=UPI0023D932C4|nr:uncharacterized protein LOC128921352 [Zeugodacus cucurbitae]
MMKHLSTFLLVNGIFRIKCPTKKKLRQRAVPDINFIVEPTFNASNSFFQKPIEKGPEDFALIEEAVSNATGASKQLLPLFETGNRDIILEPLPFLEEEHLNSSEKAAQTSRGLSAGTDRKKKLREENRILQIKLDEKEQENRSLKAQLVQMATELERCREIIRNSSFREQSDPLELVCSNVPPQLGACIRSSFFNSKRKNHGQRYDNFFKTIPLGVFFLSPVAYRYLKHQLSFPSENTLHNFVTDWPRFPGCTQSSIKSLEIRCRGFSFEQKFVSVSCDEMSLKCHLQYDRKFNRVIGLEDYGDENRTSRLATTAMTIMVQGIHRWRTLVTPISVFLCKRFLQRRCPQKIYS